MRVDSKEQEKSDQGLWLLLLGSGEVDVVVVALTTVFVVEYLLLAVDKRCLTQTLWGSSYRCPFFVINIYLNY